MTTRLVPLVFVLAALLTASIAALQQGAPASVILGKAQAFLETLTPEQRRAAVLSFSAEDRVDWHYTPRPGQRKGVAFKTMTKTQQDAALDLLRGSLSEVGYSKAETIRELEQLLLEQEGNAIRDRELYFFAFFGELSASGTWGWRYEGHHISQNWTIVNGRTIASTPQFLGANPAAVRAGRMAGTRVLAKEIDLARALLGSLSPALKAAAVVSDEAPRNLLTSNDRIAAMQEHSGVAYRQLNVEQRAIMWSLIEEYAHVQPSAIAEERLEKIRAAGLAEIRFAWMGPAEPGPGHYYRIQGPTFLIEYDNNPLARGYEQQDANHVHSVWRDFNGDFGRDLLAAHYLAFPHSRANADE